MNMLDDARHSNGFDGSYAGDDSRLDSAARLECGICWHVYDPAEGDEVWQVPAGTAFAALPEHWRCPMCDAPKHKFMLVGAAAAPVSATPSLGQRVSMLLNAYRDAAEQLRDTPMYNPALKIEAVSFRVHGDQLVGVVITPWFMNLTVLALDPRLPHALSQGGKRVLHFPSGRYEFIAGELPEVGMVETCSLFSPMQEFAEMSVARQVAEAAIDGLYTEPASEAAARKPAITRRELLFGSAR